MDLNKVLKQDVSIGEFKICKTRELEFDIENKKFKSSVVEPSSKSIKIFTYPSYNQEIVIKDNDYGDIIFNKGVLRDYKDLYSSIFSVIGPLVFEFKSHYVFNSLEPYILMAALKYDNFNLLPESVIYFCNNNNLEYLIPECVASMTGSCIITPIKGNYIPETR